MSGIVKHAAVRAGTWIIAVLQAEANLDPGLRRDDGGERVQVGRRRRRTDADGSGANGSEANGSGANGSGTNGSGANGSGQIGRKRHATDHGCA